MNCNLIKKLQGYLSDAMDAACNCGGDHGSEGKDVAKSAKTDKDEPAQDGNIVLKKDAIGRTVLGAAEDAGSILDLTPLALRKDQGYLKDEHWSNPREGNLMAKKYLLLTGRIHADGTPCKAKSPETCPKEKVAKKTDDADKVGMSSAKRKDDDFYDASDRYSALDWYLDQDGAGDKMDFGKEWRSWKRRGNGMGFKEWYAKEYAA